MAKKPKKKKKKNEKDQGKSRPELKDRKVSKQFEGKFGRKKIAYTTTAATQVFESNDTKVSFFYVSYTQDDVDPSERPILFCFNGGPGSSTVWLNLGLYGPNRMVFDD